MLAGLTFSFSTLLPTSVSAASSVDVWWPTNASHMQSVQPFKAMVQGLDVSQYDMFWQVDGGQWNWMDTNYEGYQHKEASVDVTGWTWHGSGPYVVTFIARQNGTVIAQQSETIYVDGDSSASAPVAALASTSASAPTPVVVAAPVTPAPTTILVPLATTLVVPAVSVAAQQAMPVVSSATSNNPTFYVNPVSAAATQANTWSTSNLTGAASMRMLAAQPTAVWFGDWNSDVRNDVHTLVTAAQSTNSVPVLVAYNIPERDCGGFSSGGSNNPAGYASWIQSFAAGIGSAKAVVILEPDALAQISCLSSADQATRLQLLSNAVATLKQNPNTTVYIDAGHSGWIDAGTMANHLRQANIASANGFALNVSNYVATNNEVAYGQQVSAQLGGKHFVVDTSRNGNGSNGQWCNPSGMAIGQKPTTQTGNSLVDAYLWLKVPGESDGTCNGGPSAGTWWPDYALQLVQNAQ